MFPYWCRRAVAQRPPLQNGLPLRAVFAGFFHFVGEDHQLVESQPVKPVTAAIAEVFVRSQPVVPAVRPLCVLLMSVLVVAR